MLFPKRSTWLTVALSVCFIATNTVFAPSASAQTCVTAPADLVSCWPADFNAKDIVDNNDGTLESGAALATGLAGQAFSFDGVDAFVNVPDSTSLDAITTGITVGAWIRPDLMSNEGVIFARRDPLVSEGFFLGHFSFGVRVTVGTTVGGSEFVSDQGDLRFGQWQHIAATADTATGQVRAYVNGDPVSLTAVSGPTIISGQLSNVNNLFIGRRQSSAIGEGTVGGEHYKGLIDEVKLFNRALDATEIRNLFLGFLAQAVENLTQEVISLDLLPIRQELVHRLEKAASSLHDNDPVDNERAVHRLEQFIAVVERARMDLVVSDADADALIAAAQAIIEPLGD